MNDYSLPHMFRELVQTHEAVTLNRRVQMSDSIIDGRFIAASLSAAKLYGYESPHELSQIWRSQTEPLETFRAARRLSAARHAGHDACTQYITHIQQRSGRIVDVIKETRELIYDDEVYWLTTLRLASTDPDIPDIEQIAQALPNHPHYQQFAGTVSIAEVELTFQQYPNLFSIGTKINSPSSIITDLLSKSSDKPSLSVQVRSTKSGRRRQLNQCQKCQWVWLSQFDKRAPQCPECKNNAWDRPYVKARRRSENKRR